MLKTSFSNGIKQIILNSKPVNALTTPLMMELRDELNSLHQPSTVKGLILSSNLPKVFSAGLDLKTLVAHPEFKLDGDGSKNTFIQHCIRLLITLPMPVIAIVKGHAPAGGTVFALCADYRIGSDAGFTMGLNEVEVGLAPPLFVHRLMGNTISNRQAILSVQRGLLFNKQRSLEIGLVDRVVKDEDLIREAEAEIEEYLRLPCVARIDAKIKSVINVLETLTEKELDHVVDNIAGPEFQTTVKAILAKLANK